AAALAAAALALLAGCALPPEDASQPGIGSRAPEPTPVSLPADAVEAGLSAVQLSSDEAAVAISRDEAVEIANAQVPSSTAGDVTAYLVRLTDPSTHITDRPVWLIRYSGLSLPVFGPPLPDGADPGTMSIAYVYVDAVTGECLLTFAHS
ncbi:MAG: PepSY domain-containing protein, partial [Actinobacteria bacterium]|nr:PepSY domain-containing protein [Actinomycetota bacterium]